MINLEMQSLLTRIFDDTIAQAKKSREITDLGGQGGCVHINAW